MQPDEPINEEQLQETAADQTAPFQPADPNPSSTGNTTDPVVQSVSGSDLPDDHPATDTGIDSAELYDEGISGAAEVEDNSSQSAVTDYTGDEESEIDDQAL